MQRTWIVIAAQLGFLSVIWPCTGQSAEQPPGRRSAEATERSAQLPFALRDGDRVVLLGGTLIEREQQDGYLETLFTEQFHGKSVTFRNLGWSGDTVWGEARAGFGSPADGFKRLVKQVEDAKPTVILICYGANESYAGAAGLPRFRDGMATLCDALGRTGASIIVLGPLRQEQLPPPLPNVQAFNEQRTLYSDALAQFAGQRGYRFVSLLDLIRESSRSGRPRERMTVDGVQLAAYGYRSFALCLGEVLGHRTQNWDVQFADVTQPPTVSYLMISGVQSSKTSVRFRALDPALPLPRLPEIRGSNALPQNRLGEGDSPILLRGLRKIGTVPGDFAPSPHRFLRVRGLAEGKYVLRIDGKPISVHTAMDWDDGVPINTGPEWGQAEKLRARIIAKNRLYFYRYRPQNETYLLGFRNYEQGNNAAELAQFDALVAAEEREIRKLAVPVEHVYEMTNDQ